MRETASLQKGICQVLGSQWYALEVLGRKETAVASAIAHKGYECFLPTYKIRKVWSDRIKVTELPLFSGYVFSRFDVRYRLPILVTPGVKNIVGSGRIPTAIAEPELDAIRSALRSGFLLQPCDRLHEGDRVLVTKGPLTGAEGLFVRYRGRDRLVLAVSLIQRSVSVEMDRACVEPLSQPPKSVCGRLHAGPASRVVA